MDSSSWIALGALLATGIGYAVCATIFVSRGDGLTRERLSSTEVALREKIEGVEKSARLTIDLAVEKEAKLRHDLGSQMQVAITNTHLEVKDLEKRFNDLSTDVVRKPDLIAHENRMTQILEKLDAKVDELRDRISSHA